MRVSNVLRPPVVIAVLVAALAAGLPAPSVFAKQRTYRTFTILIAPAKARYGKTVWGRVRSELGLCAQVTCPNRIIPATFHLTAWSSDGKNHPFLYWVLPNGTRRRGSKLTLKVASNAGLKAQFKG